MSQTTNLGIEKLNSADYVSIDPINNALDKLDALGKCYVADSGVSGEWWYIKFSDGRALCGVDTKSFGTGDMYGWGSLYCTKTCTFGAYPITFATAPYVSITNLTTNWLWACPTANQANVSTSPSFCMVSASSYDIKSLECGIYVSGRWK